MTALLVASLSHEGSLFLEPVKPPAPSSEFPIDRTSAVASSILSESSSSSSSSEPRKFVSAGDLTKAEEEAKTERESKREKYIEIRSITDVILDMTDNRYYEVWINGIHYRLLAYKSSGAFNFCYRFAPGSDMADRILRVSQKCNATAITEYKNWWRAFKFLQAGGYNIPKIYYMATAPIPPKTWIRIDSLSSGHFQILEYIPDPVTVTWTRGERYSQLIEGDKQLWDFLRGYVKEGANNASPVYDLRPSNLRRRTGDPRPVIVDALVLDDASDGKGVIKKELLEWHAGNDHFLDYVTQDLSKELQAEIKAFVKVEWTQKQSRESAKVEASLGRVRMPATPRRTKERELRLEACSARMVRLPSHPPVPGTDCPRYESPPPRKRAGSKGDSPTLRSPRLPPSPKHPPSSISPGRVSAIKTTEGGGSPIHRRKASF